MTAIDRLLKTANDEIGYFEKKSNAYLDNKTANAGENNYTKYWRDLKPEWQGEPWCDAFVSWCFLKTFGADTAQKLLCGGLYSYYTPASANYFKAHKQWYTTPRSGDVVYFQVGGNIGHTGIVEDYKNGYVITIEGNTSGASGVIQNGGGVCRKTYKYGSSYISGYGRPKYEMVVEDLNEEQTRKIVREEIEAALKGYNTEPSKWAKEIIAEAVEKGITDGSRPKGYLTREEGAAMALKASKVTEGKDE